jgi:heat shock protein HslJ
MTKLQILLLVISFCVFSCSTSYSSSKAKDDFSSTDSRSTLPDNEYIYWVNSLKAQCIGVAPMQCLQIQKGNEITTNNWKLFYSTIEGFDYEQGYQYKIIVKEEPVPTNQIPSDSSSIKYTLVKVLMKKLDGNMKLHDIWVLESIKGERIDLGKRQKRPQLEINLQQMKISGNDGCNNFSSPILNIDSEKLIFSNIAVTRKYCIDMDIPNRFHQNIIKVDNYSIKDKKLYLFDQLGNELFCFKKTD